MEPEQAGRFAHEWIAAWNAHDLDAILAHYAEDVEFASPFIRQVEGEPSGRLCGREALRAYWARALAAYPQLHFELLHVLTGIDSVVLYYRSVKGLLAAETMELGADGRVTRVLAHYCAQ